MNHNGHHKQRRSRSLASVALAILALGLTACASSKNRVVATVGGTAITKTELNHWMSTLAAGDFYEVSHKHMIPAGLVSEPANYPACVSHLEAAAANAPNKQAAPPAAELLTKCQQLHQALKTQAMTFLVETHWLIALDAAEGITATSQEVTKLFNKSKAETNPNGNAEFQQYLTRTRRSLTDELYVTKLDVLRQKTQDKLTTGSKQTQAKLTQTAQTWTTKTNCNTGYIVEHCKQYKETPTPGPSAAILLEQIAVITGQPCINRAACA